MAETKFTPGPWRVGTNRHGNEGVLAGSVTVAAPILDEHLSVEAFDANTRLIAAAPDLFAALDGLTAVARVLDAAPEIAEEVRVALAALAKARGES